MSELTKEALVDSIPCRKLKDGNVPYAAFNEILWMLRAYSFSIGELGILRDEIELLKRDIRPREIKPKSVDKKKV